MIREIKYSDKKEVLRISSQIWEGDDYVGNVFDEWVKADDGLFTGYWEDEKLIGFGRMRFLTATDVWLEALRKDPRSKIKGVGNIIAKYYMEQLKGRRINSVRFSTYYSNISSIKLNEKLGFKKNLTLSLKELKISNYQIKPISKLILNNIDFEKLNHFIPASSYLKRTNNFISRGWIVQQYTERLLKEFHSSKKFVVYYKDGEIKGAILFSDLKYNDVYWIGYIDAKNEIIYKELLNYAVNRALENNCRSIQLLVPELTELMNFVDSYGFKSWERNNDFLLYEMPKHLIKRITGV